jgi:hypothetical protein
MEEIDALTERLTASGELIGGEALARPSVTRGPTAEARAARL